MGKPMSFESIANRRQRAARLFAAGFTQAEIARRCGVSRQTASRWAVPTPAGARVRCV
jgi:DNA-binding transcriptional regulator LsrR (DeoR family)